ncbi:phage holin [Gorillibacterium sp. sgz5001074]|uniref:phage holin n=1 Tax=Gorillibacterium sp. sgz5001074 TaxID=3446695 RepID=UPI003F664E5F
MQTIMDAVQPYVATIVQALVGLLVLVVLAGIAQLKTKVLAFLESRTSAAQRETLHKLAAEAYAYVERQYAGTGEAKLNAAVQYVIDRLDLKKWGIDTDDVTAAIEKAWAELDTKNRGGSNG